MKPRVIIADDHLLFVEGLRRVVEAECQIVHTSNNGHDLVEATLRLQPDLVLLDIVMPRLNGLAAARQIRNQAPQVRLIFVTMQTSRKFVKEAFDIGVSGYVPKQSGAALLRDAIHTVIAGRVAFSQSLLGPPNTSYTSSEEGPSKIFRQLTPRQREVLQLVGEGHTARQIAQFLCISVKTVEFHKKQLMLKFGARNSVELVRYALSHGLT